MYVRTQENQASNIPIVACLEDFQGGGSYHFIGAKNYINGLHIDTNWTQIIVPLWHFPVNEEEVNINAIKQMQFQLEGSGSFYIDDIKIINYDEDKFEQLQASIESKKPKGEPNQNVYRKGEFDFDAWGNKYNTCQTLNEVEEKGNKMIKWNFYDHECVWAKWGINWNGWYPINLRGVVNKSTLSIRYKQSAGASFRIKIKDFSGKIGDVFVSNETRFEDWRTAEIPLKDLNLKGQGFQLDNIRELQFEALAAGEILIDEIKISE